jgi:hypothetical protein
MTSDCGISTVNQKAEVIVDVELVKTIANSVAYGGDTVQRLARAEVWSQDCRSGPDMVSELVVMKSQIEELLVELRKV